MACHKQCDDTFCTTAYFDLSLFALNLLESDILKISFIVLSSFTCSAQMTTGKKRYS